MERNPNQQIDLVERLFPALTELQEAYVLEYVANPKSRTAAARRAGYTGSGVRVTAHRMMQNDKVLQAITVATMRSLAASAPKAVKRIDQLVDGANSEYVRLEASRDVLTRLGLTAPVQHRVGGSLNVTFDLG